MRAIPQWREREVPSGAKHRQGNDAHKTIQDVHGTCPRLSSMLRRARLARVLRGLQPDAIVVTEKSRFHKGGPRKWQKNSFDINARNLRL
jgi:hypothetical protein